MTIESWNWKLKLEMKIEVENRIWKLKLKTWIENLNRNLKLKIKVKPEIEILTLQIEFRNWNCWCMYAVSFKIFLYFVWLKNSWFNEFLTLFAPTATFLGPGSFKNMFHDFWIYTNNFCFGYIAFSWLVGGWKMWF